MPHTSPCGAPLAGHIVPGALRLSTVCFAKVGKEECRIDQKGLLIVMTRVEPEEEEALHRWYNEEHLPRALARFSGVLSGR
jgi:hypothetical protein